MVTVQFFFLGGGSSSGGFVAIWGPVKGLNGDGVGEVVS